MQRGYEPGGPLEGFTEPVPFVSENLDRVPNEPGVHMVWGPDGSPLYAGMTGRQRERLRMHLAGDRDASVLHKKVGLRLDEQLGRPATQNEIQEWLGTCGVAWAASSERQRLKARIMKELQPELNEVMPVVEEDAVDRSPWDVFSDWARIFYEDPAFDSIERNYKLRLAEEMRVVRDTFVANGEWLSLLDEAFHSGNNNLTRWNQHNAYIDWARENRDEASRGLSAIWDADLPLVNRISEFADSFPSEALRGVGMRTTIASVLLLGDDPKQLPPFKPSLFNRAYRLVAYPTLPTDADEAAVYEHALRLLDRIADEVGERGMELRDRLDSQALLWSVLKNELPEYTTDEQAKALALYRGETRPVWWVNQGGTYRQERAAHLVWAPQQTRGGYPVKHHTDVLQMKRGDTVIHYANTAMRSVGRVTKAGHPAHRPSSIPSEYGQMEGFRANVMYFDLDEPISFTEIPEDRRIEEESVFTSQGNVKQGYLYGLPTDFSDELRDYFADRWPEGSPWYRGDLVEDALVGNDERRILAVALSDEDALEAIVDGTFGWHEWHPDYNLVTRGDLIIFALTDGDARGIGKSATISSEGITQTTEDLPYRIEFGGVADLSHDVDAEIEAAILKSRREGGRGILVGEPEESIEQASLADVVAAFSEAVKIANLDYGERHEDLIRAFAVSLATKRFVLLTGLSGSGKTRLAMAFGQWLGDGQYQVDAVRPDWTGPDALLGYEDGLSEAKETGRAWHVPRSLQFMLKAARDPGRPYLLILDEMNLAHVERYFADVLSGMESDESILPNLVRDDRGEWRPLSDAPARVPFPVNLFVAGTVNIDETTYMFSPKVLDRANTLEFRVQTEDLSVHAEPPDMATPGSDRLVGAFLSAALGATGTWDGSDGLANHLVGLHQILAEEDREFGHRVFFEAQRFGALLASAGDAEVLSALDLQVMQKILPRLHGSLRQLSAPLATIGEWAYRLETSADGFDPLGENVDVAEAKLPISFDKIRRMTRRLRANHFVSFAE